MTRRLLAAATGCLAAVIFPTAAIACDRQGNSDSSGNVHVTVDGQLQHSIGGAGCLAEGPINTIGLNQPGVIRLSSQEQLDPHVRLVLNAGEQAYQMGENPQPIMLRAIDPSLAQSNLQLFNQEGKSKKNGKGKHSKNSSQLRCSDQQSARDVQTRMQLVQLLARLCTVQDTQVRELCSQSGVRIVGQPAGILSNPSGSFFNPSGTLSPGLNFIPSGSFRNSDSNSTLLPPPLVGPSGTISGTSQLPPPPPGLLSPGGSL